jgi:dihydropteroate synthase
VQDNVALLRAIPAFVEQGVPLLVGTSRKSIIGTLAGGAQRPPLGPVDRFEGSLAAAVWSMACGAAMVRVHDVAATVMAASLLGDVAVTSPFDDGSGSVE